MAASFLQGGEFVLRSRSSVEELKIQNNLRFKNWILIGLTWHRSLSSAVASMRPTEALASVKF